MNVVRRFPSAQLDERNAPAYPVAEAAHYLRLPAATLRSWTFGRAYPTTGGGGRFRPLIRPASGKPPLLSFSNLIEAHVLRALRTDHGVSIPALRKALRYAERELGIERLLLRPELRTEAGKVFLERYGNLIDLSNAGQIAMRCMLEEHLKRVEWDRASFPVQLYPFMPDGAETDGRSIVIDFRIGFGRPVIAGKSISTRAIAERIDAGEAADEVAADYDLPLAAIEQAAVYERAA
jgi:uncharacterized protein (DUF433 family)